ncbi:hypothetical protein ABL78_5647 [Leptomonas seymouri]|uniref:Uncharacterized protein n=1 Tax=Leptomonas seymouri TaxID=5684 RepID=A0A0N0P4W6_LEPSE|nr:hypothetical protein ABL78_5647 [Leptomonas seymouri]|eukprot:KPI85307.1 hypothetical protein ABL78_5647 [Leptomonas seymouri]
MESLRKGIVALVAEEASARAKLSRSAQEVATMLLGQMIMGAQMIEMNAAAPRPAIAASSSSLGLPHVASDSNSGWGDDDDGFEEVDMTSAAVFRPITTQSSTWGAGSAGVSAAPASASTRVSLSPPHDSHRALKKSPPITPLAYRGVGPAVPAAAATPTPLRRPGGMSLRKKSPPMRSTPTRGAVSGGFGSVATPMSGVRPGATPSSSGAASTVKPLHPGTRLPGHPVKMDDDDKWDDW